MNTTISGICLIAILALNGSTSYASIPGTDGVITGCMKAVGDIRLIDMAKTTHCNANETLITWSQTGPPGVAGPQGIQGPQGPAGISGASFLINHVISDFTTTDYELVGQKFLTPGNYVFIATVDLEANNSFYNNSGVDFHFACELRVNGAFVGGTSQAGSTARKDVIAHGSLTFNGAAAVPAGGQELQVYCQNDKGLDRRFEGVQVLVMQVGGFF